MRKILLVALLIVSACGKKGGEAKGDCAASVDHGISLSTAELKKSGVADATIPKIKDASITRCKEDKWSNAVLKCFTDSKTSDDVKNCQKQLTKEQNENLEKALISVMATEPDVGSGSEAGSGSDSGSGSAAGSDSGSAGSAAPTAGLPAECAEYKAALEKIMTCDKLPQASRDMMKTAFDTMSESWASIDKMPEAAKTALVNGCKQGTDGLKKAGAGCGL